MRRVAMAAALAVVPMTAPALALEVAESVFQVTFNHNSRDYALNDTYVPLLPGNACYTWYLRTDQPDAEITIVERMTLPSAIEWTIAPGDGTVIEEDGKVAVTTVPLSSDGEGWITHGWCAAEGDPTGSHLIELSADGVALASFPFEVVDTTLYVFPAAEFPERAGRSANNTW